MHIFSLNIICFSSVDSNPISKLVSNALLNPSWWATMKDEMHALKQNET